MSKYLSQLVGKYFIAPFPHQDGIVESVIDDAHYLVRFEADPGPGGMPESFAIIALSDMVRAGMKEEDDGPPCFLFFDEAEKRVKYRSWIEQPSEPDKPRIPPTRCPQ
jgi:hypothetical protein